MENKAQGIRFNGGVAILCLLATLLLVAARTGGQAVAASGAKEPHSGSLPLGSTAVSFTDSGISLPRVGSSSVSWGDYDNDGKPDLLLMGRTVDTGGTPSMVSRLYHNTGSGFEDKTTIVPGMPQVAAGMVAWGDYDGDGKLDFLISGDTFMTANSFVTKLYHNTGSGFEDKSAIVPALPQASESTVDWGDYDGDGKLDFLISGVNSDYHSVTRLYHNTGSGFEDKSAIVPALPQVFSGMTAWGDYDNDDKLDFIIAGLDDHAQPVSRLYHNTGSGFEDESAIVPDLPQIAEGDVAWADYDNDGKLDFLIAGDVYSGTGRESKLYHNTGTGFEDKTNIVLGLPQLWAAAIAWGDYDNDGKLDFLITGSEHSPSLNKLQKANAPDGGFYGQVSKLYHNTGSGFEDQSAIVPLMPQIGDGDMAWSDYDGDGKLDFIITGINDVQVARDSVSTVLYHNSSTTAGATATATRTPSATATVVTNPCADGFSDVHAADYFYEGVQYLVCHGAISGYSDGTFRPFNNTTRGQLSKIVVLARGWALANPATASFSDTPVGSPFYQFVETAVQHSIISGYSDSTFKPNNNVTRGQLSKIIVLAQGWTLANPATATFSDVVPGSTFYQFAETAVQHGIISGYDIAGGKEFRPGNNATRGQIAKIVYLAVSSTK